VRGAGGYQLFGVTPAPIYDPQQQQPYLQESMVFFRAGDIVQFKPINRQTYDDYIELADSGKLALRIKPVEFDLDIYLQDPERGKQVLQEVLYGD
jgi:hypothetical protein